MTPARNFVLLALLVLTQACGSGGDCVEGRSVPCVCPGGGEGAQICERNGTYGACDCGAGGDAGPNDAGPDDASFAPDIGANDTGSVDSGAVDCRLDNPANCLAHQSTGAAPACLCLPRCDPGYVWNGGGCDLAPDAGFVDTGFVDTGVITDTGVETDSGVVVDTGIVDGGVIDTGVVDTGVVDTGVVDSGVIDTGVVDGGVTDAGFVDTGFADTGVTIDAGSPNDVGFVDAGTSPCLLNSDCPSNRCHPVYQQCIPSNQLGLCSGCQNSDQCGLPGDECLTLVDNLNQPIETVCMQACLVNGDCPSGYSCQFGGYCYPTPGSIRLHTCAAYDDMFNQTTCDSQGTVDMCGIQGVDDGTCFPLFNQCVVGCDTQLDCPEPSVCTDFIIAKYCM